MPKKAGGRNFVGVCWSTDLERFTGSRCRQAPVLRFFPTAGRTEAPKEGETPRLQWGYQREGVP